MDIYKLKKLSHSDRMAILEGEQVEHQIYMRPLESEEVSEIQTKLAQACIGRASILEEKADVMDGFKERLKPLEKEIGSCIDTIRNRAEEINGPVYRVSDFDNKMVHTIDPLGNVLGSRPMKPEERQHKLELNAKAS